MPSTLTLDITGFDYEARGVARHDGKTHFVSGALPGERVTARVLESKKRYAIAEAIDILIPAPERVPPACPHYAACGGCALQHASDAAQHRLKETVWLEQLARIGGVRPQTVLPAVSGADWHYRARTRLAWDGEHLGYRARAGNTVVPITHCLTLAPALSARLPDIRALCAALARSADARAERARQHAYLAHKNRIEGLPNPPADSLEARLAQHHINGDISAAQLVAITRLLPR